MWVWRDAWSFVQRDIVGAAIDECTLLTPHSYGTNCCRCVQSAVVGRHCQTENEAIMSIIIIILMFELKSDSRCLNGNGFVWASMVINFIGGEKKHKDQTFIARMLFFYCWSRGSTTLSEFWPILLRWAVKASQLYEDPEALWSLSI